ncbi:MAG: hypothetical protein U0232_27425 [Thermomicrobiales bacterium]
MARDSGRSQPVNWLTEAGRLLPAAPLHAVRERELIQLDPLYYPPSPHVSPQLALGPARSALMDIPAIIATARELGHARYIFVEHNDRTGEMNQTSNDSKPRLKFYTRQPGTICATAAY